MTYREVIGDEKKANITLNRKMLAELAITVVCRLVVLQLGTMLLQFCIVRDEGAEGERTGS